MMQERIQQWVQWGVRQLEGVDESPYISAGLASSYWDEAYDRLYDLILDEYDADSADVILDRVTTRDVAVMAAALWLEEEEGKSGWIDRAIERLLRRYDAILSRNAEPVAIRYYGDAYDANYRSDADPGL